MGSYFVLLNNCNLYNNCRGVSLLNLNIKRFLAGHSKWANIKHIKAAKDSQKSALFTRMSRQMRVAIEEGGSASPSKNLALAQAIEQAKKLSMPMSSIQHILKSGEKNENVPRKSFIVEIKGPGGLMIIVEVLTHNYSKVKTEFNAFLKKSHSSISEGVKYLFDRKGIIQAVHNLKNYTFDEAIEHAIEGGADDVNQIEGEDGKAIYQFFSVPDSLISVRKYLENLGYSVHFSGVEYIPMNTIQLNEEHFKIAERLLKNLRDYPDAVAVYDNIS